MKRIVIASVLFVVALTISFTGYYKTKEIAKELVSKIESIYEDASKEKDVSEKGKQLSEYWKKKSQFMYIVLEHDTVEEIEKALFLMEIYAEKNSHDEYLESCAEALSAIEKLMSGEMPKFKNIF